jgi:diguanylate cyclase
MGGVLQALARFPLETESLDAESAKAKITEWMRHATMGAKHPSRGVDVSRGVAARDLAWPRAFRWRAPAKRAPARAEGHAELRQTIWSIITSAHRVAEADASRPVSDQLERVRSALEGRTSPRCVVKLAAVRR